jgi:PleD family two-component response regulator
MNRVIEANFLPRETDVDFSLPSQLRLRPQQKHRILIVGKDKNISHLVKVLLEKTGSYLVFEENDSQQGASQRPQIHAGRNAV